MEALAVVLATMCVAMTLVAIGMVIHGYIQDICAFVRITLRKLS